MKKAIAILSLVASVTATATTTTVTSTKTKVVPSTSTTTTITNTTAATPTHIATSTSTIAQLNQPATANHLYFSTNFIDLTKGTGNAGVDFIVNDHAAASLRFQSSSTKEDVKKGTETNKITVDRTSYALGVSFYPNGINNRTNFVISPALAFGTKKDLLDVENQSGLSVKMTALLRVQKNMAAEIGVRGDNLETSEFKGDIYAGVGYLF